MKKVIFRKIDGNTVAIFPEKAHDDNPETCLMVRENGTKDSINSDQIIRGTQEASENDITLLTEKLIEWGYGPIISVKRASKASFDARFKDAAFGSARE